MASVLEETLGRLLLPDNNTIKQVKINLRCDENIEQSKGVGLNHELCITSGGAYSYLKTREISAMFGMKHCETVR